MIVLKLLFFVCINLENIYKEFMVGELRISWRWCVIYICGVIFLCLFLVNNSLISRVFSKGNGCFVLFV